MINFFDDLDYRTGIRSVLNNLLMEFNMKMNLNVVQFTNDTDNDPQTALGGANMVSAITPTLDRFRARNEAARRANERCANVLRYRQCNNVVMVMYPSPQCVHCFNVAE